MVERSSLECLKREWDVVFKAPAPTREKSVLSFLKEMGKSGTKDYEYERLVQNLVGPSGTARGQQQPSPLGYYRSLSEQEREQFHGYVDEAFSEVKDKYPEAYQDYLNELNGNESVFIK